MICPYLINISLLLGAIISWGILWPWIEKKKGIWYSADIPASSLSSIQGYRVHIYPLSDFYKICLQYFKLCSANYKKNP